MKSNWDQNAAEYGRLVGQAHTIQSVLYPLLAHLVKDCKRVIDYGCGDGALAEHLVAEEIILYDQSEVFLSLAAARLTAAKKKVSYVHDQRQLPMGAFDAVLLIFVLMSIKVESELIELLTDIKRIKTVDGTCYVAISHPCFRQYAYSYFRSEFADGSPFHYRKDWQQFALSIFDQSGKALQLENIHLSLATTLNQIIKAGFEILKIDEIYDENPSLSVNEFFPPYLLIHCR